jgi:rhamnulokinase
VISVVGGGSQDQLVCQLIADVSGRLVLAGPEEASALGNVLVQMISMGDLASLGEGKELLRLSFAPRTHEPQPHGGLLDAYQDYLTHYGLPL